MKKNNYRIMYFAGIWSLMLLFAASCGNSLPLVSSASEDNSRSEVKEVKETETAETSSETEDAGTEASQKETAEVAAKEDDRNKMTDRFISKLSSATGITPQDIRYYLVDDFDKNGKYEGFMFIGTDIDEELNSCEGEVWFVNERESRKLHEKFSFLINKDNNIFSIIEGHDKNYVAFSDLYVTQAVTNMYYIDGDSCEESAVSGIGDAAVDPDTGDLIIIISAYDCLCEYDAGSSEPMWTGHSWKPYYFYYSRNIGDFTEYGASAMTGEELNAAVGSDLVSELEGMGYTVDSIIKRDNGIINVNYSKTTENNDGSRSIEYKNATYDTRIGDYVNAWGDDEKGVLASDFGGIYDAEFLNSPSDF